MHISITSRHLDVTPDLRAYVESRAERLNRLVEPVELQVILSTEKYRHRAEMQLRDSAGSFYAAEETNDIRNSIDQAVERLEAQARRHRDKIIESHHGRRAQNAKINFLSTEARDDSQFNPY